MSHRILFACLIHETHTFLDTKTTLTDFSVHRGDEILSKEGDGTVVDGFLAVARENGWAVIPAISMTAMPTGTVEDAAFEWFWNEFAARARTALSDGVDAIFVSLHGAMVTESHPDVEGEFLERIRSLPGLGSLPLFGSLDLHANASARMARHANALISFAENPHTDARETSVRAGRLLARSLKTGQIPRMLSLNAPIVWAPPGTGTAADPMLSLERMAREIESVDRSIWAVNVFGGFSFADTPDTGVSFSLVTDGAEENARRHLDALARRAWELRSLGNIRYPSVDAVLREILPLRETPVILVEPSDNIGGGAAGDGTGILRALLRFGVSDAVVIIDDPESVRRTESARIAETVRLEVGGRSWSGDLGPVAMEAELVSRSDGYFELEDIHSHLAASVGRYVEMGKCAVVRYRGITILLTSRKTPPFDLGQLRSQGIEPTRQTVIGVKAAVAHRRAYDPIAKASYFVDTPGPCSSDLASFTFTHVRRPVYPLDGENEFL